jgi:hypothetical protein
MFLQTHLSVALEAVTLVFGGRVMTDAPRAPGLLGQLACWRWRDCCAMLDERRTAALASSPDVAAGGVRERRERPARGLISYRATALPGPLAR